MVERIDGQGQSVGEVAARTGFSRPNRFRYIWEDSGFGNRGSEGPGSSVLTHALTELRQLPEFDQRSYLVENAHDRSGRFRRLLVVPDDCPNLLPNDDSSESNLPEPNETYLARVKSVSRRKLINFLILSTSAEEAKKIAINRMKSVSDEFVPDASIEVANIDPEAFIEEARRQIDAGIRQKSFILRFGGLREYQTKRFAEREGGV